MSDDIQDALDKIFAIDSALYQERGFQRRIGYGERPALLNIDLANAWTRPGNVFYCDNMDVIIPSTQALLKAARGVGIPAPRAPLSSACVDGMITSMLSQ